MLVPGTSSFALSQAESDPSEALLDDGERLALRLEVGHIDLERDRLPAEARNLPRRVLRRREVEVEDREDRALVRRAQGKALADAVGAARDDRSSISGAKAGSDAPRPCREGSART